MKQLWKASINDQTVGATEITLSAAANQPTILYIEGISLEQGDLGWTDIQPGESRKMIVTLAPVEREGECCGALSLVVKLEAITVASVAGKPDKFFALFEESETA
jgi:hypothetical protein